MVIQLEKPRAQRALGANMIRWWTTITIAFVLALFAQAVFAGAMLSGFDWARPAHATTALVLTGSTLTAGLISVFTLRGKRNGLRLGVLLLALAAAVFVQFALGRMAAKGANVIWVHLPLGVLLIGLAWQAVAVARRLGDED
jgi:hypothetical protein